MTAIKTVRTTTKRLNRHYDDDYIMEMIAPKGLPKEKGVEMGKVV